MVLNPEPLDWESSTITTRPLEKKCWKRVLNFHKEKGPILQRREYFKGVSPHDDLRKSVSVTEFG